MNSTHTTPEINSCMSVALCSPRRPHTQPHFLNVKSYFFTINYRIQLIKANKTGKYHLIDLSDRNKIQNN